MKTDLQRDLDVDKTAFIKSVILTMVLAMIASACFSAGWLIASLLAWAAVLVFLVMLGFLGVHIIGTSRYVKGLEE